MLNSTPPKLQCHCLEQDIKRTFVHKRQQNLKAHRFIRIQSYLITNKRLSTIINAPDKSFGSSLYLINEIRWLHLYNRRCRKIARLRKIIFAGFHNAKSERKENVKNCYTFKFWARCLLIIYSKSRKLFFRRFQKHIHYPNILKIYFRDTLRNKTHKIV